MKTQIKTLSVQLGSVLQFSFSCGILIIMGLASDASAQSLGQVVARGLVGAAVGGAIAGPGGASAGFIMGANSGRRSRSADDRPVEEGSSTPDDWSAETAAEDAALAAKTQQYNVAMARKDAIENTKEKIFSRALGLNFKEDGTIQSSDLDLGWGIGGRVGATEYKSVSPAFLTNSILNLTHPCLDTFKIPTSPLSGSA